MQTRHAPEAATLIGSGKVEELKAAVKSGSADVVIFDQDLSPTQQRNLEKALGTKVIDRTQLILDIFASRARTREGRLQVELAQFNYLLPRLAGRGVEMTRQGGGIGTRGPGETQLETDRRRIAKRIKTVEVELEGVRAGRALHRRRRTAVPLATLALAGYTNAGKSTLFNRLTQAGVLADAQHVRHPGSDGAAADSALAAARAGERYGGLHPQSAHHAGEGLPRHPGRGQRGGAGAARGGRVVAGGRRSTRRMCGRCWRRSGRAKFRRFWC